jgi:hypothetical protein
MREIQEYDFEYIRLIEEDLLASEIILDLKRKSKVEIKTGKLVTIKIIFIDESEAFYKVQKPFFNKRLKKFINIIL